MTSKDQGLARLPGGSVVVVSPHLDDGIFSLGAAIARATEEGTDVAVLTVFAGDPSSSLPAGRWDLRCGFATQGEAARARRLEDERACERVGATPVWLPFGDEQYPRGGDTSTIWGAIRDTVVQADAVLVPGSPLKHHDHRWLNELFAERHEAPQQLGIYLEQPYTACLPTYRGRGLPGTPRNLGASLAHRGAKLRACRAYRTQLPWFGRFPVMRVLAYELGHHGERIAWVESPESSDLADVDCERMDRR
jgi:LmbE family N-acetylglucosaminyl deacetylase